MNSYCHFLEEVLHNAALEHKIYNTLSPVLTMPNLSLHNILKIFDAAEHSFEKIPLLVDYSEQAENGKYN